MAISFLKAPESVVNVPRHLGGRGTAWSSSRLASRTLAGAEMLSRARFRLGPPRGCHKGLRPSDCGEAAGDKSVQSGGPHLMRCRTGRHHPGERRVQDEGR